MNIPSVVTDNITEILVKIIEFTQVRQSILTKNINDMPKNGYVPKDLAVDEFSVLLDYAVTEHNCSGRLILRDTDNVKFGSGGSFEVEAIVDEYADELLRDNRDKYLELQITKLLENSLNQKIATELLKEKQGMVSIFG